MLGNANADCNITKSYATLDENLKIKIEMYIKDVSSVVITVNRVAYDNADLVSLGEGKYVLVIDGFTPYTINDENDICVIYNEKQVARLVYGVDSHLISLIEDKNQIEEDKANYIPITKTVDEIEYSLMLAIYRYASASREYVKEVA